jgi:lipopolysaccharide/colanic/teichoic acid biosynthesis glycosyltransferase
MVLASLAIMVVSPGPILFRQERIGYRGRRFSCLKFRTMLVGADTAVHKSHLHSLMNSRAPMKKLDVAGDPRLIPLGALLRSTGLDELPQIINVLRGDMSLVGPRPCVPYEYEAYRPWQKERIKGLPGLTGLWQVSGKNKTTFEQMIHLDISYLRSKSIWLDLGIMLKTVPALLQQVKELLTQFKDPVKQKSVPEEQPYYGQTS